jgi:hypothetical protein
MILVFAAIALVVTTACTTPTAEVTASPVAASPAAPASIEPSATPASIQPTATPAGTAAPTTPSVSAPAAPTTRVTTTPLGDLRGGRIYALKQYSVGSAGIIRELWSSTLEGASVTTLALRFEGPQEGGLLGPPGIDLRHIFSPDGRRIVFVGPRHGLMTIDLDSGRTNAMGIEGDGPSWTRDGRWIVYAKADPAPADFWQPFRLWAVPADLSAPPRQIPGDSVHALAGGSRIVAYDSSTSGLIVVDVADGRRLGPFPGLVGAITWNSAASQFAYVLNQQQTPGGGRPDDRTSIVVAAEDLSSPRVVVQRTGSQYEVSFQALRWNPQRDELLYSVEGVGQTPGIVEVASGIERSLPPNMQYLTWAQDGERLVGLARDDAGPRPSGLPPSLNFKRATVVVLDRDGGITRRTEISALEPYESVYQVVTVGY